jgi:hypothetical protein
MRGACWALGFRFVFGLTPVLRTESLTAQQRRRCSPHQPACATAFQGVEVCEDHDCLLSEHDELNQLGRARRAETSKFLAAHLLIRDGVRAAAFPECFACGVFPETKSKISRTLSSRSCAGVGKIGRSRSLQSLHC